MRRISDLGLVCTEMVSSKGLFYNDKKTQELLNMEGEPRPVAAQIFGSDIESLSYSAKQVSKIADIIDINMGCPAPKVVKNGDGSKLMLNLELASNIIEEVVKASSIPVTVKFRKGWDKNNISCVELAKIAEAKGASAITIHGRTREDFFSGEVDLQAIKEVKNAVKIPVIGNGDIKSAKDAIKMFEQTNVDAVMIGRGAIGNPWIFKEIKNYLQGEKNEEVSNEERLRVILKHIDFQVDYLGENTGIKELRKHMNYYLKNLPNVAVIRQKINQIDTKQELKNCIIEYFSTL